MIMLTDDADRNLTTRRSHLCAHQGRTTHTHSGLPPPSRRPSGVAKRAVALVFFMQRRLPSTSPSSFLPRPPKNPTPVAYRCEQQIPKNRPLFVLLPKFKSPPPSFLPPFFRSPRPRRVSVFQTKYPSPPPPHHHCHQQSITIIVRQSRPTLILCVCFWPLTGSLASPEMLPPPRRRRRRRGARANNRTRTRARCCPFWLSSKNRRTLQPTFSRPF